MKMLMKILGYIVDFILELIIGNLIAAGFAVGTAHVMGVIENEKDPIMFALLGILIFTVEQLFYKIGNLLMRKLA